MRRLNLVAPLWLVAACAPSSDARVSLVAGCASTRWQRTATSDSAASICLPSDFERFSPRAWRRGSVSDTAYAFLSLAVFDSAAAAREWGTPPRPPGFAAAYDSTILHAVRHDSVASQVRTIDGSVVTVETARASGGNFFDNQPVLRATWPATHGRWVFVQGWSTRGRDLALLDSLVTTVRIAVAR
jgi:hypothetical protein